jgi:hypothetical protein
VHWSPYQKLRTTPLNIADAGYMVQVNNTGYMSIANMTPGFLKKNPDLAAHYKDSSYDSPFRFIKRDARVLVVGAGGGNDVAAALRNGVEHVDAVEILSFTGSARR